MTVPGTRFTSSRRRDLPLTKGLRAGLSALVGLVMLCAVGTTMVLLELRAQAARWAAIEEIDSQREQLLEVLRQRPDGLEAVDTAPVTAAFEALSSDVRALAAYDPQDPLATTASDLVARANDLFVEIEAQRVQTVHHLSDMRASLRNLFSQSARWSWVLGEQSRAAASQAALLEQEQRRLNTALANLANATLAVTRIQSQVDSVRRYNASPAGQELPLDVIALPTDDLPPVCSPEGPLTPGAVCTPSTARIHAALNRLPTATSANFGPALQSLTWALEAYVRAGETRYRALSAALNDAIDTTRADRLTSERIETYRSAVVRYNRILQGIETMLQQFESGAVHDVTGQSARLGGLISQAKFRSHGIAKGVPEVRETSDVPLPDLDDLEASWTAGIAILHARLENSAEFEATLKDLATTVASTTKQVRQSTGIWIDVIATSALSALGLFVLSIVALFVGSYRLLVIPMDRVTKTLLALAEGAYVPPVRPGKALLGFDRLWHALEHLRKANIERDELAARNAKQRQEIEANMRDLADQAREIEWQSLHDLLTGLPNRRYVDRYLDELGTSGLKGAPDTAPYYFLHVDIDRFKEINDTIGHQAGDQILLKVSEYLKDLASPFGTTFRIGGDEFLITVVAQDGAPSAEHLAQAIRKTLGRRFEIGDHACRLDVSIGIAEAPDQHASPRQTFINVDLALQEAKRASRDKVAHYNQNLQLHLTRKKQLTDRLVLAIENDEFEPVYQPQFYSASLELAGLETLGRWRHPEKGLLGPHHFIDQAEESNLLARIDGILVRKAASDLRRFRDLGLFVPKISFNVTSDRLLHEDLADTLVQGVPEETKVAVELLESMSLDTLSERMRWAIDSLKDQGIRVEIDDFGSCRASIAGLIAVEPDAMKIDGSIIEPITTSPQHLQLVKAIIDIGNALNIQVVAERVETQAHVDLLRTNGCHILQGYALAKPLTSDDLESFLFKTSKTKAVSE